MRSFAGRVAGGALGCLVATGAYAHGVVGQRSFIEPFIAEDVNPKNEFVIARPEWDHARDGRTLHFSFGLEKKLSDSLYWEDDNQKYATGWTGRTLIFYADATSGAGENSIRTSKGSPSSSFATHFTSS